MEQRRNVRPVIIRDQNITHGPDLHRGPRSRALPPAVPGTKPATAPRSTSLETSHDASPLLHVPSREKPRRCRSPPATCNATKRGHSTRIQLCACTCTFIPLDKLSGMSSAAYGLHPEDTRQRRRVSSPLSLPTDSRKKRLLQNKNMQYGIPPCGDFIAWYYLPASTYKEGR